MNPATLSLDRVLELELEESGSGVPENLDGPLAQTSSEVPGIGKSARVRGQRSGRHSPSFQTLLSRAVGNSERKPGPFVPEQEPAPAGAAAAPR